MAREGREWVSGRDQITEGLGSHLEGCGHPTKQREAAEGGQCAQICDFRNVDGGSEGSLGTGREVGGRSLNGVGEGYIMRQQPPGGWRAVWVMEGSMGGAWGLTSEPPGCFQQPPAETAPQMAPPKGTFPASRDKTFPDVKWLQGP